MKAGRPAGEKACAIPNFPPPLPPAPPHLCSFLLGRNLRRPLTQRPRGAAAPSAGAELEGAREASGPGQAPVRGAGEKGSFLQETQIWRGTPIPMPGREGAGVA